jgi:ribosomal protein S18 acetylase RimI-like enzyme
MPLKTGTKENAAGPCARNDNQQAAAGMLPEPNSMPFRLRAYQPADFEALYELDVACYPRGVAYSRRTLRWFLGRPGAICLLAEDGAPTPGLIGFLVAEARSFAAHIITLDVSEQHRRAGAGTALLRETERRLAARGVREISLETATNNEAAIAFWQRHGYRSVGVLQRYYLGRLDAYSMLKYLAPIPEA